MSHDDLAGWTPFRVARHQGRMIVDWCRLGEGRPIEPFFHQTLSRAFASPFNLAFQRRTPIEALTGMGRGLRPSGFIFHMSRCGSTLCAQALARDPAHLVIAEPSPLSAVLRAPLFGPASEDDVAVWLDGIVNALGRPRFAEERRFFVKFTAADILCLPLIERVFPDVPWIFIYRDPGEILASHHAMRGPEMVPGVIAPSWLGFAGPDVAHMGFEDYGARCLAAFATAALRSDRAGRSPILRHDDLSEGAGERAWTLVWDHFGVPRKAGAAALRPLLACHAKHPGRPYADDRAIKRDLAKVWQPTIDRIAGPAIAALDARRDAYHP